MMNKDLYIQFLEQEIERIEVSKKELEVSKKAVEVSKKAVEVSKKAVEAKLRIAERELQIERIKNIKGLESPPFFPPNDVGNLPFGTWYLTQT